MTTESVIFQYDDGGREDAGFKGSTSDCVCRAVAIAMNRPYREIYDELNALCKVNSGGHKLTRKRYGSTYVRTGGSARTGITTSKKWFKEWMRRKGFRWVPLMKIGSGCKFHLNREELPNKGRLVLRLSKHFSAYVDGVLRDTYDASRDGQRCVYGFYVYDPKPERKTGRTVTARKAGEIQQRK